MEGAISTTSNKTVRNIIIFYIGTILLASGGGFIMASGQDAGGLLFVLSPLLMVLIVRFFLGAGWQDAGLRFNLGKQWRWYLFALLLNLGLFPLVIAVNVLLGFATLNFSVGEILPVLLAGLATQFVPRLFFALSEEWGWRGFLDPKLEQLGMADTRRHILVGILWGIWHFPLILSTDYTNVPLAIFLPLFLVGTILLAFVFGQLRKLTHSVWPAVLLHGMANTVGYAIVEGKFISFPNELLGNIVPGSLTITILYALLALWIMRQKQVQEKTWADGNNTAVPHPTN